ncbi:PAS domain S-box protein [Fredinandcohnia onubensis]|uniref:PAS domain S-box protein n=1 Tax=Fredinandcohnia onubensis TaxID=1571209 RepID=UPI000C0C05B0|nr:PAS domain S-box protein [Fredinandcohnia onubensis]
MLHFINQFEQAFHYSPIGMALVSLEGQYIKVNPALSKITGYLEEELLSLTFQEFTHPDDLEEDLRHVQDLIEGKKVSYEMEKRYIHKDGNTVWVFLSVSIFQQDDKTHYLIAQILDITEKKKLALSILESEERFRNLLTYSPDPILVFDGEIILYANESAAKLVDTSPEDMVGEFIIKFIDPTMHDLVQTRSQEIINQNKDLLNFDLKIRSKNGRTVDTVFSAVPISYMEKRAILVSYRDITIRKKMEQELTESEDRYRQLVEYSPLGILVHQKGVIKYANPTALQLLAITNAKLMDGIQINDIIHPDFRLIVSRRIRNIEDNGRYEPTLYEKFIRLDGVEIDVEVSGIPIQLNGESAVQVVFWDVTEKKKEEDLIRYRAYHDTLTDLPNRLKFQLDLAEEMEKDSMFTIMYLDLHGLKSVNDSNGHQAGDMALIKVTSRLTGVLGSIGLTYRLGGDEFAIVLPGRKSEEEIRETANSIEKVIKQPIYIANSIAEISTSIGVVFYPDHGVDMELLLRHADLAMYHAKKTKTLYKIYDR